MIYYLGLGGNIGDRLNFLLSARKLLSQLGNIKDSSALYETEPLGDVDQRPFLNAVCILDSPLRPFRLLRRIKKIECSLGRKRAARWGARNIDIDLIEWKGPAIKSGVLQIPHDGLQMRNFIYYPLADVASDFHTRDGKTLEQLKYQTQEQGWIKPFKENW